MNSVPTPDSLAALKLTAALPALSKTPDQTTVIVCPDTGAMQQLQSNLQFLLGEDCCLLFSDWETLPYDRLPVAGHLISQRLNTLNQLLRGWHGLVLTTPASLLQRLPPPAWLSGHNLNICCGDTLMPSKLLQQLLAAGYERRDNVEAPGELAFRGAVLDFFPTGPERPVRVEFLDDQVDSMRWFDPATQMGTGRCDKLQFFTGREFLLDPSSLSNFRAGFRTLFDAVESDCHLFKEICAGRPPAGSEYYLPLFFTETALLPDYISSASLSCVLMPGAHHAMRELRSLAAERYKWMHNDKDFPLLPPKRLFADDDELRTRGLEFTPLSELAGTAHWQRPRGGITSSPESLRRWMKRHQQARILLSASSEGALTELCKQQVPGETPHSYKSWADFVAASSRIGCTLSSLRGGALYSHAAGDDNDDGAKLLVLAEQGQAAASRDSQKLTPVAAAEVLPTDNEERNTLNELNGLHPGQLVIHLQHGLGRYKGLDTISVEGREWEFATLEYKDGALLRLPVSEMQLLSRYSESQESKPALDRLGSAQFSKSRAKAQKKARDDAAHLLELHARRASVRCRELSVDDDVFERFCQQFPFQQTKDQQVLTTTIRQRLADSAATSLLICGDVGFGKTEIAMRAAFIATMSGVQCCLMVPTTLLCRQHYQSFRERFAGWPVTVARLDSTLSAAEKKRLRAQVQAGEVQLLVSTHAALHEPQMPKLGLLIVDEEHRFGVSDKEHIQQISAHTLSMTATPIPRTLNRALSGLSDMLMMHEPPPGRLPVQTFVRSWQDELVREAIRREQLRGGQVFVVHDRIDSIDDMAQQLRMLLPQARIAIAHGRMKHPLLADVMHQYNSGNLDVLLSTTIIESGIDVPNANTLIVTRADRMGLAQLHQLRGRVGRSDRQAWCWLLYPSDARLAAPATERLRAVEQANGPGMGLALAREDLELRGAGELLGREQSGHIQRVGLSMYLAMLHEAVADLRSGGETAAQPSQQTPCEVELGDTALLPEEWLPHPWTRVQYYHRLAAAENRHSIARIDQELRDRFGPLPQPARALLRNARLRLAAKNLGATRLIVSEEECILEMRDGALAPETALMLVERYPQRIRLTPKSLRSKRQSENPEQGAKWLLDCIAGQMQRERKQARAVG